VHDDKRGLDKHRFARQDDGKGTLISQGEAYDLKLEILEKKTRKKFCKIAINRKYNFQQSPTRSLWGRHDAYI